jgi:O-acetylserine/cysteine efflux transporter
LSDQGGPGTHTTALPLSHALLGLAVVAVWGSNFVVITWGLQQFPPLLLAALRFTLAFFPLALLLPRPRLPWRDLAAYGLLIGAGQFGLLFLAMRGHISPGLASLLVQVQVFFTIGLAMLWRGQRVQRLQWLALGMAVLGLAWIGANAAPGADVSALGIGLILLAALCWAGGNAVVSRSPAGTNMLAYVVWSSGFAVPPLLALSYAFEGPGAIGQALRQADALGWACVLWQSIGNAMFGYAAWGWLLARHPAATVAPLALGVPVFGMGSAALLLGEAMPAWKLGAAALVLGGLALNLLWPLWQRRRASAVRP